MDVPIYRPVSIIRVIPQWVFISAISILLYYLDLTNDVVTAMFIAIITLLVYRYLIRYTVLINHVRGLNNVKKGKFKDSILNFEKVLNFFTKHYILNDYGFIIFLSPSKYTYKELALINLGFAYGQIGYTEDAIKYYEEALKLNKNNGMAITSLNLINQNTKK